MSLFNSFFKSKKQHARVDKYTNDLAGFIHHEVTRTQWVREEFKTDVSEFLQKVPITYRNTIPKDHGLEDAILNDNQKLSASDIIFAIYRNACSKHHFYTEIKRSKEVCNATEFEYGSSGDERTCDWCCQTSGKIFTIETDIIALIEKNCTCLYLRAIPLPIVKWE